MTRHSLHRFPGLGAASVSLLLVSVCLISVSGCSGPGPTAALSEDPAVRTFEFHYETEILDVPEAAETAYLWVPYPPDNEDQTIRSVRVESSLPYEIVTEPRYGNKAIRFSVSPGSETEQIAVVYEVQRRERLRRPGQTYSSEPAPADEDVAMWLQPDMRVPINDQIRVWARDAVGDASTPLEIARAVYDYAVSTMSYAKTGTGWGNGDIYWACDAKYGNCTDFHAMFIGFNRSLGVPARFEMGFPIPPDRGKGEVGGYHCWAQFYLDGDGWVPVDASEANKHPEKREYFFGAHDENRVMFTLGRDLLLPGMRGEPLNYFIYPYAEVDGEPHAEVTKRFTYRDVGTS